MGSNFTRLLGNCPVCLNRDTIYNWSFGVSQNSFRCSICGKHWNRVPLIKDLCRKNGVSEDFLQLAAYRNRPYREEQEKRHYTLLRVSRQPEGGLLLAHINRVLDVARNVSFRRSDPEYLQEVRSVVQPNLIEVTTTCRYSVKVIDWQFRIFKSLITDKLSWGDDCCSDGEIFRAQRFDEVRVNSILWLAIACVEGEKVASRVFDSLETLTSELVYA